MIFNDIHRLQLSEILYVQFYFQVWTLQGFDENGRPVRSAQYGSRTLNEWNRKEEACRINQTNAKILDKLQTVKPKILSSLKKKVSL